MSADDFSDLLDEFENETDLPLARHTGDEVVGGVVQGSTWSVLTLAASSVYPRTSREQRDDPEGARTFGEIVIFVRPGRVEGLRLRGEGSRGDVVEWGGKLWAIYAVNDWENSGGFVEVVADKLDTAIPTVAAWVTSDQGGANASL